MPNKKGTTQKILLNALNNILYNNESDMTDSNSSTSSSESSQQDQEAKWKNKISAAYEADMYGKYSQIYLKGFFYQNKPNISWLFSFTFWIFPAKITCNFH